MSKSPAHTDRSRLHEELLIKSSAIDSSVNGMVFGDLEGRITDGNASALALSEAIHDGGGPWPVRPVVC